VPRRAPAGKSDPPRIYDGARDERARRPGEPLVLPGTYGIDGALPEHCLDVLLTSRPRSSTGDRDHIGGTARNRRGSAGIVVVEAPLPGAGGNSTTGADFRIISLETKRLHSAGRSGGCRIARLTCAAYSVLSAPASR